MDYEETFHRIRRRLNGLTLQLEVAALKLQDPDQARTAIGRCREELADLTAVLAQLETHILEP